MFHKLEWTRHPWRVVSGTIVIVVTLVLVSVLVWRQVVSLLYVRRGVLTFTDNVSTYVIDLCNSLKHLLDGGAERGRGGERERERERERVSERERARERVMKSLQQKHGNNSTVVNIRFSESDLPHHVVHVMT